MSQCTYLPLVSMTMSAWGNDMRVYTGIMVVANDIRHGSHKAG